MPPNNDRANSGFRAFWSSLPGVLTGVAAVIGAGAAIAALFVGGDNTENTPTATPTAEATTPSNNTGAPANVRKLLAMLPASIRDSCTQEEPNLDEELASVTCEQWGATHYYYLYEDALEARASLQISAENAQEGALRGHARTCRDASFRKPFVGTWKRPGHAAAQLVCTYEPDPDPSFGLAYWEWTVAGRPILGEILYSGDRQTATDGAYRAWRRATR